MLIKTLLNNSYPIKKFVYEKVNIEANTIYVHVRSRKGSKGKCRQCEKESSTYDHIGERCYRFIPLWGYAVKLKYKPRRVKCSIHGIKIEYIPWSDNKSPISNPFKIFLSHWAKYLSWKEVAEQFKVSWPNVYESVKYVVDYGLKHRDLENVRSIGIDEIQYLVGHKYLTLVYQIDSTRRRLLFIGKDRKVKTLLRFFYRFGKERIENLQVICSDLWKPYLKVIKRKVPDAVHVLDRFHIMKYLNEAVDNTRRRETFQLKKDGYEPILEKSRWCWLKNKKNRTNSQIAKLRELVKYNLKTVRCYLLKEEFQHLWTYKSRRGAKRYFQDWSTKAMRSKLPEIKKVVKKLRRHKELLFNYFEIKDRVSNSIVEGFNLKAKLTMRKSYGFRTFNAIEVALYHTLGGLPEPLLTHRFY